MEEVAKKTQQTNQLFEDVVDGKIPQRVPMMINVDSAFCLEYAGMDLHKEQWSVAKNMEAIEITTRDFNSDTSLGIFLRFPQLYKILEARNFKMGADGFLQHPNVQGMKAEDYDAFIQDPVRTLWDVILPRIYPGLAKPGFEGQKVLAKAFFTFFSAMAQVTSQTLAIALKYGKSVYTMAAGAAAEPFDTLSDQLRSFSEICIDMRRRPEKVIAACEALLPICLKAGISPTSSRYNRTFVPLHMGSFMKEEDFKKFYLPTFYDYINGLAEKGVGANLFVEDDWVRYLDYLYDLPENSTLMFEYGDPQTIKEKLGGRQIISGLYPISLLKTGTEQECTDKAKELVDILAPGGGYIFGFDKAIIRLKDINPENLKAVLNCVREYAVY